MLLIIYDIVLISMIYVFKFKFSLSVWPIHLNIRYHNHRF